MPLVVTLCTGNAARSVMAGALLADDPDIVVDHARHARRRRPADEHAHAGRARGARRQRPLAPQPAAHLRRPRAPPTSSSRWRASTCSSSAARHPQAAARTATLKRLARDLPVAVRNRSPSGWRRSTSTTVELEHWEDVDDPAGGDEDVFHECATEIQACSCASRPRSWRRGDRPARGSWSRSRSSCCASPGGARAADSGKSGAVARTRSPRALGGARRHAHDDQGRRARASLLLRGRRHRCASALRARERGRRCQRAHVRLRRASATTRVSGPRTSRWARQLVEQDQVFAVVPTVTTDLGAVKSAHRPEGAVLRLGDLVELLRQPATASGSPGACSRRVARITSNVWGTSSSEGAGRAVPNPTAVILTENTPSGQVVLPSLTAGVKSAGITSCRRNASLPVPAVGDYGRPRDQRAHRERWQAARRGVRGRSVRPTSSMLQRRCATVGTPALHRHRSSTTPSSSPPRSARRSMLPDRAGRVRGDQPGDATARRRRAGGRARRARSTSRSSPATSPPTSSSPR